MAPPSRKKAKKNSEASHPQKTKHRPKAQTPSSEPPPEPQLVAANRPDIKVAITKASDLSEHVLPRDLQHLADKYSFIQKHVRSATKIEYQVQVLADQLRAFVAGPEFTTKPGIAALFADARDANKLITVVNIAARILTESTTVFQYTKIGSKTIVRQSKGESTVQNEDSDGNDSDSAFETGRWAPEPPRKVPVMVVYLSVVSIPELRERHGEQIHKPSTAT